VLENDWSPEQISGRLMHERDLQISHERIYQHIYKDQGVAFTSISGVRRRDESYDRRGQLPNRIFIDERPSVVDMRQRIGDWEGDTIIGRRHKGSLVSLVERKSLYTLLGPARHQTAGACKRPVC